MVNGLVSQCAATYYKFVRALNLNQCFESQSAEPCLVFRASMVGLSSDDKVLNQRILSKNTLGRVIDVIMGCRQAFARVVLRALKN